MPTASYEGAAKPGAELRIRQFVRPLTEAEERWWEAWDRREVPFVSHPLYSEVRSKLRMGPVRARRYLAWRRSHSGEWIDRGAVWRRRGRRGRTRAWFDGLFHALPPIFVVTNAGVTYMRDDFNDGASDINAFNSHGYGTGAVAEAVGDTALGTEVETPRGAGTKSVPASNQYRTVQTHTFAASFAITEHGIFSAATAGTLWDRSVFAAINVVSGDAIQATYTLTITSGG